MLFTSLFHVAAMAVVVTAAAVPSPLDNREAVCGSWYDRYLGPRSAGEVFGTGQCQNTKKSGEGPNDESNYVWIIKGACKRCTMYSEENCNGSPSSVSNTAGDTWQTEWPRRIAKSFRC